LLALFVTSTFPVARLSGRVNGTLVSTYQYDPYGNLTSSTGSVTNPWRFAGGYFDSSTGLYKFGTRYYNPGFGRWSQQDPVRGSLADPTSLNRYVYVGDDPVNFTDPSGRDALGCLKDAIVTIGGILIGLITFIAANAWAIAKDAAVNALEEGAAGAAEIAAAVITADAAWDAIVLFALAFIIAVIVAALVLYISCVLQH